MLRMLLVRLTLLFLILVYVEAKSVRKKEKKWRSDEGRRKKEGKEEEKKRHNKQEREANTFGNIIRGGDQKKKGEGPSSNKNAPPPYCNPQQWQKTKKEYENNRNGKWNDPLCYEFNIFRHVCYCEVEVAGPFQVQVRNNIVTEFDPMPDSVDNFPPIPTMNDLFEIVYERCIRNNPCSNNDDNNQDGGYNAAGSAAADYCLVTYGREYGEITSLSIDYDSVAIDEEIFITISDFKLC